MYSSNCYNFEWLQEWLLRKLPEDKEHGSLTSSEIIAKNFSLSFFDVSEDDVTNALLNNKYTPEIQSGHYFFFVSHDSEAYNTFKNHLE